MVKMVMRPNYSIYFLQWDAIFDEKVRDTAGRVDCPSTSWVRTNVSKWRSEVLEVFSKRKVEQ